MSAKIIPVSGSVKPESETSKRMTAYKEVITYDSNGEMLSDVVRKPYKPNGGGFVLSYTEKMCEFLERTKQGATVRVFVYIAHHQQYGNDGVWGYRCSHKYLKQVLSLDRKSIYNALSALKEQYLIHELIADGVSEFMVNPQYVTVGTDKKARIREWNLRWEEENKRRNASLVYSSRS